MKLLKLIDSYNENKIWLVKIYGKGEVYFNQEIKEIKVNSKYQRTTKRWLNQILERDINKIIANDEREEEPIERLDREFNDVYVDLFTKIHQEENNPYDVDPF